MVTGRQIAQIKDYNIYVRLYFLEEDVVRAAAAADIFPVQAFFTEARFRLLDGTGLDIKGVEDGIVRHQAGQEGRVVAVAAGHVDEDAGLLSVRF